MHIEYRLNQKITVQQFAHILKMSGLSERRPIDNSACLQGMLAHANLLVTAWQAHELVGIARSVTDFNYCCYLSDLAVTEKLQGRGIGRELLKQTVIQLQSTCKLILLAAPAATKYYAKLGFTLHENAWTLKNLAIL